MHVPEANGPITALCIFVLMIYEIWYTYVNKLYIDLLQMQMK